MNDPSGGEKRPEGQSKKGVIRWVELALHCLTGQLLCIGILLEHKLTNGKKS